MRNSWIAATGMMAVGMAALAGCSDSGNDAADQAGDPQAVALASSDDVLRELGNLGSSLQLELGSLIFTPGGGSTPNATRLRGRLAAAAAPRAAAPVSSACSGGGTDTRTTDSKSRSFSYFSFSGPISYQLDAYSNCASSSDGTTQTIDGSIETGGGNGIDWVYTVLGSGDGSVHLITTSDGSSVERSLLGTVEGNLAGGNSDELRAVLQGTGKTRSGGNTGTWQLSLGQGSTPYEMLITTSALSFSGPYAYTGSAPGCSGGNVTVATPTPLALDSGSGDSFSGGVLSFSSGGKSVTLTVNADGSAALSGNVSGTLSKDQISNALLGSVCVPVIAQS